MNLKIELMKQILFFSEAMVLQKNLLQSITLMLINYGLLASKTLEIAMEFITTKKY